MDELMRAFHASAIRARYRTCPVARQPDDGTMQWWGGSGRPLRAALKDIPLSRAPEAFLENTIIVNAAA